MRSYSLIAPGKINLYLEIIGDRPDGYHQLVMILQSIELADKIELRPNGTDSIRVYCNNPQVPSDETNLAYKAAKLMQQQFPEIAANYGGIDITIDKQIPVAAGLAGGSTDGAAVLVGIDLMWDLGLTKPELETLAAQLGSDIPFCVRGGTAIATGRGEILESIQNLDDIWVVLAKYRNLSVSTGWAYQTYRQKFEDDYIKEENEFQNRHQEIHSGPLVKAIIDQNHQKIGNLLYNDLEKVVLPEHPQVNELRSALINTGGLGTMMSGSGPTVFCLCESKAQAEEIKHKVQDLMANPELDFWITKLSSNGIQVAESS